MKKFITPNNKRMFFKECFLRLLLIAITFFSINSTAAYANSQELYEKNKVDLVQIEDYLNNIKNLSAKFVQKSDSGNVLQGRFLLSRPGKMRIEYLGEDGIIIVANSNELTYKDVGLDETSYLETSRTPASLLIKKNISFTDDDTEITSVSSTDKIIKVSIFKKGNNDAGEFSLIFEKKPLKFSKIEVKNDLDQTTSITFYDMNFDAKLVNSLFVTRNRKPAH